MDRFVPILAEDLDALYDSCSGWPTVTIRNPLDFSSDLMMPNYLQESYDDIGLISDYVESNCQLSALAYLRDQIENKNFPVQRNVPSVPTPDCFRVDSIRFDHFEYAAGDESSFRCDMIVIAQMTAYGKIYPLEDAYPWQNGELGQLPLPVHGKTEQWFRITSRISFKGFSISTEYERLSVYSKAERPLWRLDKYLIPLFSGAEEYESFAHEFLQRYQPEVLGDPKPLDVDALLEKLNLVVRDRKLSEDGSIMGRLIFNAMPGPMPAEISKNIIEIDPAALKSPYGRRATYVHEILHHVKDRYFLMTQNVYHQHLSVLSCKTGPAVLDKDNPIRWGEYQVRQLIRRIMMPYEQALYQIDCYLTLLRAGDTPTPDQLEKVAKCLASFFQVPLKQAKLRMQDLGFQMDGILNYVDGEYVPAYQSAKPVLKGCGYHISHEDLLNLFMSSEELRQMLQSGKYCYAEHHVCIRDDTYVLQNNKGKLALTDYARRHIDECCILFSFAKSETTYTFERGQMNRVKGAQTTATAAKAPSQQTAQEKLNAELEFRLKILPSLPCGYTETFAAQLKRLHVTQLDAASYSGFSIDTIKRLKKGERKPITTLLTVMLSIELECCCIADLVIKGNYGFLLGDRFHAACQMILSLNFKLTFEQFNEQLQQLGLPVLSRKENG